MFGSGEPVNPPPPQTGFIQHNIKAMMNFLYQDLNDVDGAPLSCMKIYLSAVVSFPFNLSGTFSLLVWPNQYNKDDVINDSE